jgi:2-polyprenyl-3-methyl-5-hydroxy-6-metoxy-1,4-benzoquinol methylase
LHDRAGRDYWDALWAEGAIPQPVNPAARGFRHYLNRRFHALFSELIEPGSKVLEVGCARSEWLPYFALTHGAVVTGLDYSERGCAMEREVLSRAGVAGEVICADLFDPPQALLAGFDVVVSIGVVEHFTDTAGCLAALGEFLRPGGTLFTAVPNMTGLVGALQKGLNPDVYDIHVPLTAESLARAHREAGLEDAESAYFLSASFGVVNLNGLPEDVATRSKRVLVNALSRGSKLVWALEERMRPLPATRAFAPYVVATATRP